jgi:hypothetical protein
VRDLLGLGAALHFGDLEELEVVVDLLLERLDARELFFDVGPLAQERLSLGLIVPEARRSGPIVELL